MATNWYLGYVALVAEVLSTLSQGRRKQERLEKALVIRTDMAKPR